VKIIARIPTFMPHEESLREKPELVLEPAFKPALEPNQGPEHRSWIQSGLTAVESGITARVVGKRERNPSVQFPVWSVLWLAVLAVCFWSAVWWHEERAASHRLQQAQNAQQPERVANELPLQTAQPRGPAL